MANNTKIYIDKVIDILTKVRDKLTDPNANDASVIGYIEGQIDALDALKVEDDNLTATQGSRSELVVTSDPIPADSTKGVVQLDNEQLQKIIDGMRDNKTVYVPQVERIYDRPYTYPWWQQVTYCQNGTASNATATVGNTDKITMGDLPQSKPRIPSYQGADCRA
jgi:hypothetical protein